MPVKKVPTAAAAKKARVSTKAAGSTKPSARRRRGATASGTSAQGGQAKLKAGEVIVRMYRQGLGDCFLLFFPRPDGKAFKMMIDCGVIAGTPAPEERMQEVVRSIIASTDSFVDVLVITHEHWDHVSGFIQAAKLFSKKPEVGKLTVGEVWLAWTENDDDPTAQALQGGLKKLLAKVRKSGAGLKRLAAEAESLGASKETVEGLIEGYEDVLAFFGFEHDQAFGIATDAEGGGRTREALRAGAGLAKINYLAPGEKPWTSPELPGVRIFTLGPPKDPEALRRTDPGVHGYHMAFEDSDPFSAALAALSEDLRVTDAGRPFDDNWGLPLPTKGASHAAGSPSAFIQDHYLADSAEDTIHHSFEGQRMAGTIGLDQRWRRIGADWVNEAAQFALQLDGYTNNTSLVLAIELSEGGPVLLFVGDAQAGNWLSWDKLSWRVDGHVVTARDLLGRTCFYKVGHHGSHNATLKGLGLELMTRKDIVAFVPVDRTTARKKRWKRMPLLSIMEKLGEITKNRVVLSEIAAPKGETSYEYAKPGSEFSQTDLYLEVRLPMH